jgi:hypothetical protein
MTNETSIRTALSAVLLTAAFGLTACAEESPSDSASSSSENADGSTQKTATAKASCGTKATDDCTPHVSSTGSVRVDALVWRVKSARTTKTLGDQQYGLGAKADGMFVVVKLRVHSKKNESATLTDNVMKLSIKGDTYDADTDGTTAALTSGQEPFFFDTVGPDANKSGTVVFDVPKSKLNGKLEMRFGELGLGSTHGYIRLPSLN